MTVLFLESFNHMAESLMEAGRWTNAEIQYIGTDYARFNGMGIRLRYNNEMVQKTDFTPNSTMVLGFAMRLQEGALPQVSKRYPWIRFHGLGTTSQFSGTKHVEIHLNPKRQIAVYRGATEFVSANPVLLATSDNQIFPFEWYYIEVKVKISQTVGYVEIRVNGEEWLSVSGNTYNGTDLEQVRGFRLACPHNESGVDCLITNYDDIYVDSDTFRGDLIVNSAIPTGDGSHNDFTPSAGNRFECVDEPTSHTQDIDYITGGAGDKNSFTFITGSLTGTPIAVQLTNAVRKTTAGAESMKGLCRSGGSDYLGTLKELAETYEYDQAIWETDPNGGDWNQSKIEAAEFGLQG